MSTVPNTVKDISRAVADLEELGVAFNAGRDDAIERVANNLAYVMGKNVALGKVTGRDVSVILASNGFTGDLRTMGKVVARRVRALRFEYGSMSPQI